jgi:streptogramin lyase
MKSDLRVGRSVVAACLVICGVSVQMLPTRIYAQQRPGTNPDYTISLFAGGPVGFAGDGGQASTVRFNDAAGLAIDRAGTMYIADEHNHRIRMITSAGQVTTIAGTGAEATGGDGGPAHLAQLNTPSAVAVDAAGTIYVAEYSSNRVRKITGGVISTLAGPSDLLKAPKGIAVTSAGDVFVAALGSNRVVRISPQGAIRPFAGTGQSAFGGDGVLAVNTPLNGPFDVAVDSVGNVYIAEFNRIRKVGRDGLVTTIAGGEDQGSASDGPAKTARFRSIYALTVDRAGNVYVCDTNNHVVRKISAAGVVATIAGNGASRYSCSEQLHPGESKPAMALDLRAPSGVAISPGGEVFVSNGDCIVRLTPR